MRTLVISVMHKSDTFKINQINEVPVGWIRSWDARKEFRCGRKLWTVTPSRGCGAPL